MSVRNNVHWFVEDMIIFLIQEQKKFDEFKV